MKRRKGFPTTGLEEVSIFFTCQCLAQPLGQRASSQRKVGVGKKGKLEISLKILPGLVFEVGSTEALQMALSVL